MHSSRDANSFSRASPRVRSLNLPGARTNNFHQRYGRTELAVILSVILLEKHSLTGWATRKYFHLFAQKLFLRFFFFPLIGRQMFYFNRYRSHSAVCNEYNFVFKKKVPLVRFLSATSTAPPFKALIHARLEYSASCKRLIPFFILRSRGRQISPAL